MGVLHEKKGLAATITRHVSTGRLREGHGSGSPRAGAQYVKPAIGGAA